MAGNPERDAEDPAELPVEDRDTPEPPDDVTVAVVAAVAENGVIGDEGGLPWHYPADLRHFRETTMDHPVVMGRRTYEGIVDRLGEPLPGRTSVVLTSQDPSLPDGAVAVGSVEAALDAAREALAERHPGADAVHVVGGASVYEQFLPVADRLVITEIPESPDGDTYFPDVDCDRWQEVARETADDLAFVTYERRES